MEPFLERNVDAVMVIFLFAALAGSTVPSSKSAVAMCRPVLAQKAGGEIATIDVRSSRLVGGRRTLTGRLTAFLGMGPPAPGSASAHHLIRADFIFRCQIGSKGVRAASVSPLR